MSGDFESTVLELFNNLIPDGDDPSQLICFLPSGDRIRLYQEPDYAVFSISQDVVIGVLSGCVQLYTLAGDEEILSKNPDIFDLKEIAQVDVRFYEPFFRSIDPLRRSFIARYNSEECTDMFLNAFRAYIGEIKQQYL